MTVATPPPQRNPPPRHTPPPQHERIDRRSQLWPSAPLDVPSLLAWLTKPVMPFVDRFGMRIPRRGPRSHDADDILLPSGYRAEVVATGLSAPVMAAFGPDGAAYVVESGHKVEDPPRIRRVDIATGEVRTVHEFGGEDWIPTGALTGVAFADRGTLIATLTDRLVRLEPDGSRRTIVDGLPGRGDHQVNHPLLGPDGKIYFGVGSVTNCGVVGSDNAAYGWLRAYPDVHDVPARDIVLAGRNYEDRDVLAGLGRIRTGAFVPFGTETTPGQVIPGNVKASGAILRCEPDGTGLEVVAWGLRNPYGLAFTPDGRLLATEHGMDSRSPRHIVGDYDDLYEIEPGRWYGWPDFASGIRLDDPRWGTGGQGREPALAEPPEPQPPMPVVSFEPHVGSNGLAVAPPGGAFGFGGQAFVALFGDLAPITTPRLATPVGFKVVRVDIERRAIVDFAVNRIQGPASKLPHAGFERPSHCVFGPDSNLYVTDFGEIDIAPEKAGIRIQAGTGTLWRIRRLEGQPTGVEPPPPTKVPFYAAQYAVWGVGLGVLLAAVGWFIRRARHVRRSR